MAKIVGSHTASVDIEMRGDGWANTTCRHVTTTALAGKLGGRESERERGLRKAG